MSTSISGRKKLSLLTGVKIVAQIGASRMKESYFLYALIVLVAILGCMVVGAVIYIGVLQVENEVLTQENQELGETIDGISDEIRVLSDRIEEITRDVEDSEDWNKEAYHE